MTTLPGLGDEEERATGGSVYQGVCAQVRALFPNRTKDPSVRARYESLAGVIASARSLAASIDRVSGVPGTRQASGHQLALMHGQLAELLERLDPETADERDPFAAFLKKLNETPPTEETADERAAASPHREV